jgi:hypothetical protein
LIVPGYNAGASGAAMAGESTVYFEHMVIGANAKLVAIDERTGLEVTVIGPARTPAADLKKLALAKLKARIAREQT